MSEVNPVVETVVSQTTGAISVTPPAEPPAENVVETPVVEEVAPVEEKISVEDYSSKLVELKKKESLTLKKEKDLLDREKKIQTIEDAIKERSLIKTFQAMGYTFEQAMQKAIDELEGKKEPDINEKLSSLEKRILEKDQQEQAQKEQQKKEHEMAVFKSFVEKTTNEIKAKEEYELVNKYESYNLVIDVINEYFNEHGTILAVDKAAAEVEQYLEKEMEKFLSTKKFQAKHQPQPAATVKSTPTTLSNAMAAATATKVSDVGLSKEERIKIAAAKLKFR